MDRKYQINLVKSPWAWIPQFITDYRSEASYSIYQQSCNKREEKYRKRAQSVYDKRFDYDPYFGHLNERALTDTAIALLYWTSVASVKLLKSISCNATLSRHVCTLIKHYQLLNFFSLSGNYNIIFKNWLPFSALARRQYQKLSLYWEETLRSLQYEVLIAQAAGHLKSPYSLDDIWTEITTLAAMERNLNRALSQENSKSSGWNSDVQNESDFFKSLDANNPIWQKLYGYKHHSITDSESHP